MGTCTSYDNSGFLLLPTLLVGRQVICIGLLTATLAVIEWCHLFSHQLQILKRIKRSLLLRLFIRLTAAANDSDRSQ